MIRVLGVAAFVLLFLAGCVSDGGGPVTSSAYGPAVVESCGGDDECAVMVADRPNEVLYFAPGASWAAGPLYTVPWEPTYMLPYRVRYYNGWGGTVVTNTVWRDVAVRRGWNRSVVVAHNAPRGVMPFRGNPSIRLSDGRSIAYNNRHSAVHQVRLNQGRNFTPRPPVHAGVTPRHTAPPQHTRPPQHTTPSRPPTRTTAPPSRPPPRATPPQRPPQHVTTPRPAPRPAPPPQRRNCGGHNQPKC